MKKFIKILCAIFLIIVIVISFSAIYSTFVIHDPAPTNYISSLPGKIMAVTIPPFGIYIEQKYQTEGDKPGSILAHERIHWLQYQERGFLKFYYEYLGGWIKHGRLYNNLEKDARKRSSSQVAL